MTLRQHATATFVSLAGFAVVWAAFLSTDLCGNEDNVECTTWGWVLLYAWIAGALIASGLAASLIVRLVVRWVRRQRLPASP